MLTAPCWLCCCAPPQIFPRMKNYTPYNRATSVGNQLLNNYRKFLLAYEACHRPKDLAGATRSAVTEVGELGNPKSKTLLWRIVGPAHWLIGYRESVLCFGCCTCLPDSFCT